MVYFFICLETETIALDLQVFPPSSPLSSTLSASEPSSGTPSHCSSLHLPATEILSRQTRNSDPSNSPSTSQTFKTWPDTFQVPWEKMPKEIRSAIVDGKRPKPVERRQMVRVLVDEMRMYEANPNRSQCLAVIRNIIRQYPKSFADMTADGSLLGGGYTSLLIQVKNRIENVNREVSFICHRASRESSKRGPSDSYGCSRFQPDLPPEETDECSISRTKSDKSRFDPSMVETWGAEFHKTTAGRHKSDPQPVWIQPATGQRIRLKFLGSQKL